MKKTTITGISHDGRGICRINNKTTFVEGALPGEEVTLQLTKQKSQYNEAKVVSIKNTAATRTVPKCKHFGTCGGCALQHMSNQAQLKLKQQVLLEQLQHFGNLHPQEVLPPLTSPSWSYRHKARLGVKYVAKKEKVLVGFREKNSRFLADVSSCEILASAVGNKIAELSKLLGQLSIYRAIPQIEVASTENTTALVFRTLEPATPEDIALLTEFASHNKFQIYLQPGDLDSITPIDPRHNYLSYTLELKDRPAVELQFQPSDFTQINPFINQQMVTAAISLLEPTATDTLLDLFCGLGNFTLPLARYCRKIIGVEGNQKMVERANFNALNNLISNAEFYCANLAEELSTQVWAKQHYDKILLDPPRTGAAELIPLLPKLVPSKILYISCNPATLARDAGELVKHGYTLEKAGIMDMFPHTKHVESIALFTSAIYKQ